MESVLSVYTKLELVLGSHNSNAVKVYCRKELLILEWTGKFRIGPGNESRHDVNSGRTECCSKICIPVVLIISTPVNSFPNQHTNASTLYQNQCGLFLFPVVFVV